MLPEQALVRTRENLADSLATGDLSDAAHYHFSLGFVHLSRNEYEAANRELEAGLKLAVRIGDVAQQTKCLTYLALTHRKLCHLRETEHYSSRALGVSKESNNRAYVGAALANLAWIAWRRGNLVLAEQHAQAAIEAWKGLHVAGAGMVWALWVLLGIELSRGQIQAGMDCAKGILDPSQWLMPPGLSALVAQALQAWQDSNSTVARAHLEKASELAKALGYL